MENPNQNNSIKNNVIFYNNIWITGNYQNKEIIGRTCIHNNNKMVTIVDENSSPSIVPFSAISDVGKIVFLEKNKKTELNEITKKSLINFLKKECLQ
jgi:sporulation protein YlmC with PRC-barrel domain